MNKYVVTTESISYVLRDGFKIKEILEKCL